MRLQKRIKKIRKKRPDLKLIIASATLDADAFASYFRQRGVLNDTIILGVEGRQHSVDIQYLEAPCPNYLETTIQTVSFLRYCMQRR